MREVFGYLKRYVRSLRPLPFAGAVLSIAVLIFCNFYFGWNGFINSHPAPVAVFYWAMLFSVVFHGGYAVQLGGGYLKLFQNPIVCFLLLAAPWLFAWKMVVHFQFSISANVLENEFWNNVIYWPLKGVILTTTLLFVWRICSPRQPFYGTAAPVKTLRPYLYMLLIMVPLVAGAATQPDFLSVYPKMQKVAYLQQASPWYLKLLYELSYGSDFFSIELFFRGFLVLAFAKYVGEKAVLPMALFYCTIHFGKPLGECISSFFGGLVLGAVTLQTRSIWGGLMVHLGIAWLMELAGFLSRAQM